ncbi:MAG: ABC transporter ATP-binding protein [Planctomycetia bacterium]|nr:ABC transporter ATP-binding protein [Planctomycetia bacterium]
MLEVAGITKTYPAAAGDLRVLDGASLTLGPGERLTVMGPSGSGKSTLLSIVGGLEEPTAGTVRLDGVDPFAGDAATRARFRNRRIGFVFQEHHLLDGCTAIDNVLVPALASGRVPRDLVARAAKLLERVGLGQRLDHHPGQLSGGERQRVAVARSLLLSPRLVLADEPTGQLDSHTAGEVTQLLIDLVAESGGMLVVVTHDESVAARVGSVRHLRDGRLGP